MVQFSRRKESMPVIPGFRKLNQDDLRVQISLGYKVKLCLKKLKPKQTKIETTNDDQRILTPIALQT